MLLPTDVVASANNGDISRIDRIIARSINKSEYDLKRETIKNLSFTKDHLFNARIINKINFENCYFEHGSFGWSTLTNVSFNNCELLDSSFSHTILKSVSFSDCHLGGSHFQNIKGTFCMFTNTKAENINFQGSVISDSDINISYFWNSNFSNSKISNIRIIDSDFTHSKFRETIFKNVDFQDTNLISVVFLGSEGLLNPIEYLSDNFEWNNSCLICYTVKNYFEVFSPGDIITTEVNYDRTCKHGSGIDVYTKKYMQDIISRGETINGAWECKIKPEWLPGVVVPYNPGRGVIRAAKVLLDRRVDRHFFYR